MSDELVSKVESNEKRKVAATSVGAAALLTVVKLIVGLMTGSLGILSEALHSGLDLVAAIMTFFAVKIADKPADLDHNFGHGKVENLSALGETGLLLITCVWIIYEAVERLSSGNTAIHVNYWSFGVIILSIVVDIGRSRALMRVAKKYNSQALEADALHFSTDILSSGVVLVGLIGALIGYPAADAIAALVVAAIVIWISYNIGKKSVDSLLDRTDESRHDEIVEIASSLPAIRKIHNIRVRTSGPFTFIDVNIHLDPHLSIIAGHEISECLELKIKDRIERCDVHVHIEPEGLGEEETIF